MSAGLVESLPKLRWQREESIMSDLRVFSIRAIPGVAVLCLAVVLTVLPAAAQGNNSNYVFLIASGFLCDPGDSSTCPGTAKSNQGDSYEMSGAGTFDAQNKSVNAGGTYTHKSPNGSVLETGVWLAGELVKFDSYGAAPGALRRQGLALGPAAFGPTRTAMPSGPMPTGGLAVFRIRLLPMRGPSRPALLEVNSVLGEAPRERAVEGIRLGFEGNKGEFSEETGGRMMFLSIRPEVTVPVKPPHQTLPPGSLEPPRN
jgi:hypothetical protein